MAVDSDKGEGDLEIGLASPEEGGGAAPVGPGRPALDACTSGKRLDQSPPRAARRPGLVMSNSGKRLDQSPAGSPSPSRPVLVMSHSSNRLDQAAARPVLVMSRSSNRLDQSPASSPTPAKGPLLVMPGSGKRLDQSLPSPSPSPSPTAAAAAAPVLVLSNSGKRMDQAGRKKYVKQVTGRHNDTELHLAAQRGDLDAVRQIIAEIDAQMTGTGEEFDSEVAEIRAAVVNEPNEVEETALLIAAERGFLDIVVELLKHSNKESLARKNKPGFDALHVAAKEGHRDIVKVLLDHDPSLGKTFGQSNVTPLITAAIRGHIEVVNLLLERVSGLVELSKANGKTAVEAPTNTAYPVYGRLLPCPLQDDPPRIEHLVAREDEAAADFISRSLSLPPLYVADLIKFGAVYYALVAPQPPPYAAPEHVRIFREVTEPSVLRRRASIKGKTVREAQKTFRVTDPNQRLEAGTYVRVHVHPKRFPRCYEIDWKSRVIAVTDNYVVLDKPAATSVGGATDNIEESCVNFTSRALGLETPLMTTHQIDNCSEGCVVLSKTKEFCSVFHGLIREKQVTKFYLALTTAPVFPGITTHYMRPVNRAPRLVSEDHIGGWHLCQMEILDCKKVPWPSSLIRKVHNVDNCGWPQQEAAYECKINLLTGKTHQIRAQLAAIGTPIVGDSAYMTAAIAAMANPSINPFGRESLNYSSEEEKAAAVEAWIACHGKEPKSIIGLQASEISWDYEGVRHSYKAGVPWWRQDAVESDLV